MPQPARTPDTIADALRYYGDKLDLRKRLERTLSLDPQEGDLGDTAVDIAGGFIPGVSQALAVRDIERARRANDPAGMALASTGLIPGGKLADMLKKRGPVMSELDVFHGSPHKFDEFDASKIGTGEGAQAYGHGIYLAENPKVAEGYKERLAASSYTKDSQPVAYGKVWQKAADAALETGTAHPDYSRAISSQIMDWVDAGKKPETFLRYNRVPTSAKPAYEAALKEYTGLQKTAGNLYHADLPDEMVNRMLHWDKPLSEQPPSVQYLLSKIDPDSYHPQGMDYAPEEFGQMIYARLANSPKAKTQAEASAVLKAAGIPGIQYLDAGSRGQNATQTRNFVVFPGEEKKVKILSRDGEKMAQALKQAPVLQKSNYRGLHTAPTETAASADNLTKNGIYPNDVYSRPDWYETGDALAEMRKIHQFRGNPDADVTIYRAVPKDVGNALNVGDWVTTSRKYAKQHGEGNLGGDYKIVSKKVKAKDIYTNGDSIFEWGYHPTTE